MVAYGPQRAEPGQRCSNSGQDNQFTSPCCYADFEGKLKLCPECGAPIVCRVEREPVAVCTIATLEELALDIKLAELTNTSVFKGPSNVI